MSVRSISVVLNTKLSDWIAELHANSLEVPWREFKQWCFCHLLEICQFDSGLWWSRSDLVDKEHSHWPEDTFLFKQPDEFMANYSRIAERPNNPDPLNLHLNTRPGTFFSIWDVMPKGQWYQTDYYNEHCAIYGIENAISVITLPSKYSSVTHIFSFYRAERDLEFTLEEKATLASLLPHLLQAFSANLLASFDSSNKAAVTGIVDRYGKVVMAEEGFTEFMTEKGLLSQGRADIPNLRGITEPVSIRMSDVSLELSFHDGLVFIEAFEHSLVTRLSKRQSEVCQLITKGLSNKEIASLLDLKVGTINNHVQKALRVLKVKSREAATSYLVRQGL